MHIESAKIIWVGETYTRPDKKVPGALVYYRDFVCQWHDNQSGHSCSLKFTVRNNMQVISNLSTDLCVSLDYTVEAKEWHGKYFNNTRILGNSLHCVARKG